MNKKFYTKTIKTLDKMEEKISFNLESLKYHA